jgi:hypothetical protein
MATHNPLLIIFSQPWLQNIRMLASLAAPISSGSESALGALVEVAAAAIVLIVNIPVFAGEVAAYENKNSAWQCLSTKSLSAWSSHGIPM